MGDIGAIHTDTGHTRTTRLCQLTPATQHTLLMAMHLSLDLHTNTCTRSWSMYHLELSPYG